MTDRVLTLRELNRAALARQMLLDRASIPAPEAVEHLVGLQAQQPQSPFLTLWTRLQNFQRDDLARLIENRSIIKATMMRATLHLFTAADYVRLRGAIQPALDRSYASIAKQHGGKLNIDHILSIAKPYIMEQPRSFAGISAMFSELMPDIDIGAIRYTVRMYFPMVQVPNHSQWSYPGNPTFTPAETWLGQSIPMENNLQTLVFRYLAAFGPASVADIQRWSGLAGLKSAVESFKSELVTYRDEQKRELLDLPTLPIPDADTPAPVRFLPDFDNLLIAYDKRTRIIADEYRSRVYLSAARVEAT
ncbi:MAG TPA: winged helix DNA-binding domain-containing protein, partial [Aggregatilineales bacterium]|nr:winged helix DNA-binding domain-containing protein [Aggregatilineales bacterium]